jgi:hypothetical protein
MFLDGAAAPHFRDIFISFERAVASLVKRYSNVTQGVAALLVKKMLLLYKRAATFLVKRYSNVTQGCGRSSGKKNVNFM